MGEQGSVTVLDISFADKSIDMFCEVQENFLNVKLYHYYFETYDYIA